MQFNEEIATQEGAENDCGKIKPNVAIIMTRLLTDTTAPMY